MAQLGPREYEYTIVLDPDPGDGTYSVTVPILPGVVAGGSTLEEAVGTATETIHDHIAGLLYDGEPVPEERHHVQTLLVRVGVT